MMMNRQEVINEYAQRLYEMMDNRDVEEFIVTSLIREFNQYTDDQLETEILDMFPDLLESE